MKIYKISKEELPKKKIFSISYSLLTRTNNKEELLNYIFRKEEGSVELEFGKLFHSIAAEIEPNIKIDFINIIDGTKVYLSPDSISKAYVMNKTLSDDSYYLNACKEKVEREKMFLLCLEYKKYKFMLKSYIDFYCATNNILYELKTTNNPRNLNETIFKYNYDLQAYLYKLISYYYIGQEHQVKFIFVTKYLPHNIIKFDINSTIYKSGEEKFYCYFNRLILLIESNNLLKYFCINDNFFR